MPSQQRRQKTGKEISIHRSGNLFQFKDLHALRLPEQKISPDMETGKSKLFRELELGMIRQSRRKNHTTVPGAVLYQHFHGRHPAAEHNQISRKRMDHLQRREITNRTDMVQGTERIVILPNSLILFLCLKTFMN